MAVQAQYVEYGIGHGHGQQSPIFFSNGNSKERAIEAQMALQPPSLSTFFSDELTAQTDRHDQELRRFLLDQGERLRRTLAERRERSYRALLTAAEESAAKRMREKQAELDRAARRTAELEDRLVRVRSESLAWQAKAIAEQAAAWTLQNQLHEAASAPAEPEPDEDAESAHVDPVRSDRRAGLCRSCRVSPTSVVLLPCRHLCLCTGCDAVTAGECCPVCRCASSGSVQVFFS